MCPSQICSELLLSLFIFSFYTKFWKRMNSLSLLPTVLHSVFSSYERCSRERAFQNFVSCGIRETGSSHENPRDTHLSGYSIKGVLWWNMPGKHVVLDPFPGASWCPLAHWWTWKEWKCDHKTSLCATPCRADAPRGKLSLWFRNKLWELFMFFYWLGESCQMMASK